MIRTSIACIALLCAFALAPAVAADWPARAGGSWRITEGWAYSPYLVVNQGPEYSGPNIKVVEIGMVPTNRHLEYPFIARADNFVPFGASSDYYTTYPTTIHRTVRGRSAAHRHGRHVVRVTAKRRAYRKVPAAQ